jgi:hypothetical protein
MERVHIAKFPKDGEVQIEEYQVIPETPKRSAIHKLVKIGEDGKYELFRNTEKDSSSTENFSEGSAYHRALQQTLRTIEKKLQEGYIFF